MRAGGRIGIECAVCVTSSHSARGRLEKAPWCLAKRLRLRSLRASLPSPARPSGVSTPPRAVGRLLRGLQLNAAEVHLHRRPGTPPLRAAAACPCPCPCPCHCHCHRHRHSSTTSTACRPQTTRACARARARGRRCLRPRAAAQAPTVTAAARPATARPPALGPAPSLARLPRRPATVAALLLLAHHPSPPACALLQLRGGGEHA